MTRETSTARDDNADERQPLLANDIPNKSAVTPLPKGQIALLSALRFAEPLGFSICLVFVNPMVERTGVEVEDIGFYVGWIESLFSLAAVFAFIPTGHLSNRFGRRPTLTVPLFLAGIWTIAFGFSTTIVQMMVFRFLAGVFSGGSVIIRTLFAENKTTSSDETNRARAFSFFAFASNASMFLGTALGALLAEPYGRLGLLGHIKLFKTFPYALPCIFAGGSMMLSALACLCYLKEPPSKEKAISASQSFKAMLQKDMIFIFLFQTITGILAFLYTALWPLWLYTPVRLGGLSFTIAQLGYVICLGTASQAIWLLVFMPPIDKRLGTRNLLRLCLCVWPFFFSTAILANQLAFHDHWHWVIAIVILANTFGTGVAMAFTSIQLLTNALAPPGTLAVANGIALTLSAILRAVCPALVTNLFAVGLRSHVYYLAWYCMIGVAIVGALLSPLVPREKAANKEDT